MRARRIRTGARLHFLRAGRYNPANMMNHDRKRRLLECAVQGLILLALLVPLFPGVFLRGEAIAPADVLLEVPPWSHYAESESPGTDRLILDALTAINVFYILSQRALEQGEWPLWNHLAMGGMPLLANAQSAVFYPPRLLLAAAEPFRAVTVYILLKLWLCGFVMYLCARGLGWGVPAARFASVAWMLSGFNLLWCYWPLPDVAVWAPPFFLGLEWLLRGRRAGGFWLSAAAATLMLLGGHPETAFVFGLGFGTYLMLRLALDRTPPHAAVATAGLALAAWFLALAVSAAQVLPLLEYLANTFSYDHRAGMSPQARGAYTVTDLAALWVPRFFGTWKEDNFWGDWNSNVKGMLYPGMAVWVAAAALIAARPGRVTGRRALALAVSTVPMALLAFDVPSLRPVYELPPFGAMWQHYHIIHACLAVVLIAGEGVDTWFAENRSLRQLAPAAALLFVAALVVGGVYMLNRDYLAMRGFLPYLHRQVGVAALAAALSLLVLAAHCARPAKRLLPLFLTVVLALDLFLAVRGLLVTSPREMLFFDTALTGYLQDRPEPLRVGVETSTIPSGLMAVYGVEEWGGYDGIYPERVTRLRHELRDRIWHVMEPACSVQYYLHDTRTEPMFPSDRKDWFERAAQLDGIEVYRNPRAFPRAYLVGGAKTIKSEDAMFEMMADPAWDPGRTVLLDRDMPASLPPAGPDRAAMGSARVVSRTSTKVDVEVDARQGGILVLADGWYPGWRAFLDGRELELFPANYAFRGVLVPPGAHYLAFRYDPFSFRLGMAISVFAMVGSIAACAVMACRRVRGR